MKKVITLSVLISVICMLFTGCGIIDYFCRENPQKAMKKYLDNKYNDDVTLVKTDTEDSYFAIWNKKTYGAQFTSEKIPGEIIGVSARVNDDNTYTFRDGYQRAYHVAELKKMIEEIAQEYIKDEYYIKVYQKGEGEKADVPMMDLSEYSNEFDTIGVCILIKETDRDEALREATQIQNEIELKNIRCEWSAGIYTESENDPPIEERVIHDDRFNPWIMDDFITFIYKKDYDGKIDNYLTEQ